MASSVPSGKSKTEPPRQHRWGEVCGSAIAIFTLILPAAAIIRYSPVIPVSSVPTIQNLPLQNLQHLPPLTGSE